MSADDPRDYEGSQQGSQWRYPVGGYPVQAATQAGSGVPASGHGPVSSTGTPGGSVPGGSSPMTGVEAEPPESVYVPLVDIVHTSDEIHVIVDTPGFDEEEITLEVDDDVLIVTAERESEFDEDAHYHRNERPLKLERIVPLPLGADPDHASAKCNCGETKVVFQKNETERHHQIGFQ